MSEFNPNWPPFLDTMNSQPRSAAVQFYKYVVGLLEVSKPRALKAVPAEYRNDLFHDIVVHCIRDDFRVLRQYKDMGRPFAAWFYFVANNKIRDFWDKEKQRSDTGGSGVIEPELADTSHSNPGSDTQNRQLLDKVNQCIRELDDHCQVLLRLAAEEYKPREIVRVLGWAKDKAKKISNDLAYCRKKLMDLLSVRGIEV
jgi:RNA polymerase sigma factor (sigma-70 family)